MLSASMLRILERALAPTLTALVLGLLLTACGSSGEARDDGRLHVDQGEASYYAGKFVGRPTASGEIYDPTAMTAAHRRLPFGTKVRVTRLDTNTSIVVRINDRGPFKRGRVIDLSREAARQLDMIQVGIAPVRLDILDASGHVDSTRAPVRGGPTW